MKKLARLVDTLLEYASPSIYGSLSRGILIITALCYLCNTILVDVAEVASVDPLHFYYFLFEAIRTEKEKEYEVWHKPHVGQSFVAWQLRDIKGEYPVRRLVALESVRDYATAGVQKKEVFPCCRIGRLGLCPYYSGGRVETSDNIAYDE